MLCPSMFQPSTTLVWRHFYSFLVQKNKLKQRPGRVEEGEEIFWGEHLEIFLKAGEKSASPLQRRHVLLCYLHYAINQPLLQLRLSCCYWSTTCTTIHNHSISIHSHRNHYPQSLPPPLCQHCYYWRRFLVGLLMGSVNYIKRQSLRIPLS